MTLASPKPPMATPAPRWDRNRVLFVVAVDGQGVDCAISREALQDLTGRRYGQPKDFLAAFAQFRDRIEGLAADKARARSEDNDALLTIWSGDITETDA